MVDALAAAASPARRTNRTNGTAALPAALLVLAACGGGGGSSSTVVNPPATPQDVLVFGDLETDGRPELFAVAIDGSGRRKVSDELQPNGGLSRFYVSPDGARVAYAADQDVDGTVELYVTDTAGLGASIKVSGALGPNADVGHSFGAQSVFWAPDSQRLCFLCDADIDGVDELWLVHADGTGLQKVNGSVGTNVEIGLALWSPDGRYVAQYVRHRNTGGFRTDRFAINAFDSQAGAPNSTRITGSARTNWLDAMRWSDDGTHLAYVSDQATAGKRELFVTTPAGTASNVRVNQNTTGSISFEFKWTGGGRYLVYQESTTAAQVLWLHDIQGAPENRVRVSPSVASTGRTDRFQPSPDGAMLAFLADQDTAGTIELFVADADGSNVRKVSAAMVAGGNVVEFAWSPDGTRLAYAADALQDGLQQLYVTGPDGLSPAMPVTSNADTSVQVQVLYWAPDGGHLLAVEDGPKLLLADATGVQLLGDPAPLAQATIVPFGGAPWSLDGSRAVFLATDDPNSGPRSYSARAFRVGSGTSVISGSIVAGGSATAYQLVAARPLPTGIF